MPARPSRLHRVGTWLSLVEHSLGVRGVGSSNLPVPTNIKHFPDLHPVFQLQELFGRDSAGLMWRLKVPRGSSTELFVAVQRTCFLIRAGRRSAYLGVCEAAFCASSASLWRRR